MVNVFQDHPHLSRLRDGRANEMVWFRVGGSNECEVFFLVR